MRLLPFLLLAAAGLAAAQHTEVQNDVQVASPAEPSPPPLTQSSPATDTAKATRKGKGPSVVTMTSTLPPFTATVTFTTTEAGNRHVSPS